MAKQKPLPKRVQRIVDECSAGQKLCLTIRHSEVGDERLYWLEPSGKSVGECAVAKALRLGVIEPKGDSLFPDMESQTYGLPAA